MYTTVQHTLNFQTIDQLLILETLVLTGAAFLCTLTKFQTLLMLALNEDMSESLPCRNKCIAVTGGGQMSTDSLIYPEKLKTFLKF